MIDTDDCVCGMAYADFRTGETFGSIRSSMWIDNPDSSTWRYKRRGGVLGAWRQLKLRMWSEHRALCDRYAAEQDASKARRRRRC